MKQSHVVVIGSGVAGLTCALTLIEHGYEVTIITKSQMSESATWYAQGGVASVMFEDDTEDSHINDTLIAGAGICNIQAVEILVHQGATALKRLINRGATFDVLADGSYARTREGGHHVKRIIHAGGDATGEEIERTLVKAANNASLDMLNIIDYHMVTKLLHDDKQCVGVQYMSGDGLLIEIEATHVVLATGGSGQLFEVTTNPILATGDGVAVAYNAGVLCGDLEFMQFHPTALHVDNMPRPLLSEALRGEGAILRDENGYAFMKAVHELGDLAPRDIVSKAIANILKEHKIDHVYLDATEIKDFASRFPTIYRSCEIAGIDPTTQYMPVSPAAHYYCGGVLTDVHGATSLSRLWAAGEVACNGVHGANRLASNSLLDGLVYGERVAKSILQGMTSHQTSGIFIDSNSWTEELHEIMQHPCSISNAAYSASESEIVSLRRELQKIMTQKVGVIRDGVLLNDAKNEIDKIREQLSSSEIETTDPFALKELVNLVDISNAMINNCIIRTESRGCHNRLDYPDSDSGFIGHFVSTHCSSVHFIGETP